MASTIRIYISPELESELNKEKKFGEDRDATIIRILKEAQASRSK